MDGKTSNHEITLDERGQEQPTTKHRAVDPSSKSQPEPDSGAEAGKYPKSDRGQSKPSEKT